MHIRSFEESYKLSSGGKVDITPSSESLSVLTQMSFHSYI